MESKDQKMVIQGVQYHEKKDLQVFFNEDGAWEKYTLSHMRSIGDRKISYTANKKIVDGEVSEWIIQKFETTMDGDELAAFKKNWEDNWHPMIGEPLCTVENDAIGIMENFLQGTPRFS
jgi:hypothetical protein